MIDHATLRNALADLGFPSVLEMPEDATIHDYFLTVSDAWDACDQTEEDAIACAEARLAILFQSRLSA